MEQLDPLVLLMYASKKKYLKKESILHLVWWHTPVIPVYRLSSRPAWLHSKHIIKIIITKNEKGGGRNKGF
jgi:hypothetical protein